MPGQKKPPSHSSKELKLPRSNPTKFEWLLVPVIVKDSLPCLHVIAPQLMPGRARQEEMMDAKELLLSVHFSGLCIIKYYII